MENLIRERLALLHEVAPDSIGDLLRLELESAEGERDEYWLRCRTQGWMRNAAGTLHGGMGATILDQALGTVAYCRMPGEGLAPTINLNVSYHRPLIPGEGLAPTIDLNVSYHRPLIPGEDVRIWVHALSVTRTLLRLEGRAYQADRPDRLCLSATATYFYKPGR